MERPAGFFFPDKMTSLDILDMSFINFDVFSQYLELDEWLVVRNLEKYVRLAVSAQYWSPNGYYKYHCSERLAELSMWMQCSTLEKT